MFRPLFGLSLVILLAAGARAEDPGMTLDKARQAYISATEKARMQLLDAFAAAAKTAMTSGNLDALKMIQAEKDEFEKNGKVPTSTRMKTAVATYQQATKLAAAAYEKALDNAVRELTKAGKIAEAEAAQEELKKFRAAHAPPKPTVEAATHGELQKALADTTWTLDGGMKLKADGYVQCKLWESAGLAVKWEAVDRRTVVIVIEKGRDTNRTMAITFSEDLTEFGGFMFDGKRMPVQKRTSK